MKVILKQAVPKLGKSGQVVNVKPGYARNFLFPKGMAVVAERGQLKALETINARLAAKLADTKAGAEAVGAKLNGQTVKIGAKVGGDGKLFGAITSQDIADAIQAAFGETVEKKDVALLQPIKRTGKTPIEVDLHRDVDIRMTVLVFDEAKGEEKEDVTEDAVVEEVAADEAGEGDAE